MRNFLKAIKKVSRKVETVSALVGVGLIIAGAISLGVGCISGIINVWG